MESKGYAIAFSLLLLAGAMAGCSGKAGGTGGDPTGTDAPLSSEDIDNAGKDQKLKATDKTGIIRGVVVDAGIHPLADATVIATTAGKTAEVKTNAKGAFGFPDLKPGTYFLRAQKFGYSGSQVSAEVVAGENDPPVVKIQLFADGRGNPSVEVFHFPGYLECTVLAVGVFSPCVVPGFGLAPDQPVGNDDFAERFNVTANVTYIQGTLVWTPTGPGGTQLYFNLNTATRYQLGYGHGTSPVVVTVKGQSADAASGNFVEMEVTGWYADPVGLAGAVLEQSFDGYIVVTHNFEPPAGYDYLRDGEPKLPT